MRIESRDPAAGLAALELLCAGLSQAEGSRRAAEVPGLTVDSLAASTLLAQAGRWNLNPSDYQWIFSSVLTQNTIYFGITDININRTGSHYRPY
ncbi:hypothetical protein VTN00DRAFT_1439 [Thermoascus crustaceus]|uniref:uncharacterized protein n=1 Tax=Thermoascus crustaceus TaxID=5088 RepID=UPI00374232F6